MRPGSLIAGLAAWAGALLSSLCCLLEILAVLVRTEPDGYVFRFVNFSEHDYRRLRDTVRRSTSAAVDG